MGQQSPNLFSGYQVPTNPLPSYGGNSYNLQFSPNTQSIPQSPMLNFGMNTSNNFGVTPQQQQTNYDSIFGQNNAPVQQSPLMHDVNGISTPQAPTSIFDGFNTGSALNFGLSALSAYAGYKQMRQNYKLGKASLALNRDKFNVTEEKRANLTQANNDRFMRTEAKLKEEGLA